MEGFTKFKKMQCFKEGGSVQREIANYEKRERKVEEKDDEKQDKKIVKKAFSIHDSQQHEKKTDLTKLNKGGRAKKTVGTVKKFEKASGEYGAKKTTADKKNIKEAKQFKPVKLCGGKSVKKMADGGMTDDQFDIGGGVLNAIGKVPMIGGALKSGATTLRDNVLGTPEQNRIAQAQMDKVKARKAAAAAAAMQGAGAGKIADAAQQAGVAGALSAADMNAAAQAKGLPAANAPYKKGGKAKCK